MSVTKHYAGLTGIKQIPPSPQQAQRLAVRCKVWRPESFCRDSASAKDFLRGVQVTRLIFRSQLRVGDVLVAVNGHVKVLDFPCHLGVHFQ